MTAPTRTTTLLAGRLLAAGHRPGPYRLPDGTILASYFDPYLIAADPDLLADVATALAELLPTTAQLLAAPVLAAVAPATALSLHTGLPVAYLRPNRKPHGTDRLIEGADVRGLRAVVVDDTARTGTSLITAVHLLREHGAGVDAALCLLDRDLGATGRLRADGVELRALVTAPHPDPR